MPSPTRVRCKVCGGHKDQVGAISRRGKCGDCAKRLVEDALDDLHYHRGPTLLAWRRGMAASVGALLVDDVLSEE